MLNFQLIFGRNVWCSVWSVESLRTATLVCHAGLYMLVLDWFADGGGTCIPLGRKFGSFGYVDRHAMCLHSTQREHVYCSYVSQLDEILAGDC